MASPSAWLLFLFGLHSLAGAAALFFELSERSHLQRCFYEEYDEGMTIAGTYKIQDYGEGKVDPMPGSAQISVTDPGRQVMLRKDYKGTGSFAFATSTFGFYEICFMKVPSPLNAKTRVHLHYDVKSEENFGMEAEMNGNSTSLKHLFSSIDEQYEHVLSMYLKFKKREKRFRDLSQTTNSRIIWWAVLQVVVLVVTAAWQMRHLTRFFVLKKIV